MSTLLRAQAPTVVNQQLDEMCFRWLREYVPLIITDEEKASFLELETPQERLAAIERFWQRRDPTPGTPENEAREEHARRFGYVNQHFSTGKPGWKTDRGRIYMLLGPPQNRSSSPMGRVGGERASETWTYNSVKSEHLPASFDLYFVDFNDTGDYQLVSNLDLAAPIRTSVGYVGSNLDLIARAVQADLFRDPLDLQKNSEIFDYDALRRSTLELEQDLQSIDEAGKTVHLPKGEVETRLQFVNTPLKISAAHFRAGGGLTRTQLGFSLDFSEFQSKNYHGLEYFHVELLSRLLEGGKGGKLIDEARDELPFQVPEAELASARKKPLIYQLDHYAQPGVYTLEFLVRDAVSGRVSVTRQELEVPDLGKEGLGLSTPLLCESIQEQSEPAGPRDRFRLGKFELLPRISGSFLTEETLHLYVQVYGAKRDASGAYSLQVDYRIWAPGNKLVSKTAPQAAQGSTPGAVAVITAMPLRQFPRGGYELEAIVWDKLADVRSLRRVPFSVE